MGLAKPAFLQIRLGYAYLEFHADGERDIDDYNLGGYRLFCDFRRKSEFKSHYH
jgi:hypothetical protein